MNQELFNEYSNLLADLNESVNSVSEVALATPPAQGEWSPAYILHHIADCEIQFQVRFSNTLAETEPTYRFFNEDVFPEALHYEARSPRVSLLLINALTNLTIEMLQSVDQAAWSRVTLAEDGSRKTLLELFEKVVGHRKAHLEQLRSALK